MTGMCWKSVVKEGQLTNQRSVGRSVRRTDGFIAFTPESKQESHASKCRESAVQLARSFILTHAEPYNNITSPAAGDCFERSISGWERASALGLQDPFSCLFYFLSGRTELIFILHFFSRRLGRLRPPRGQRGASAVVCNRRDALAPQAAFPQLAGARHENVNWAAH
jgi:hypothetical protein